MDRPQFLTWLHNFKEPDGQLARWIEKLQEYNCAIIHRQGKRHQNADTLSRRPDDKESGKCNSDGLEPQVSVIALSGEPTTAVRDSHFRTKQLEDDIVGPI